MSTAFQHNFISVQEYLDGEIVSQQKHEYVDGVAYAQAGASNTHNQIATNATVELAAALVYQRGEERFEKHVYTGLGSRIPLPEIGCDLSLGAVYDGIDFPTQA
jgi:hypothetical protein